VGETEHVNTVGESRRTRRAAMGGALAGAAGLLVACGGAGGATDTGAASTGPLKMAFAPHAEAHKLIENMRPFVSLVEKESGLKFETSVATSYAAVIEAMGARHVDVAWMGPLAYAIANQKYKAQVLAISITFDRSGQPLRTYPGGIIVKADSPYKTIQELRGKKFAFVDPTSASGYLYPLDYFVKQGIGDPKNFFSEVTFAGGHDKVVTAVLNGQVEAGAIYLDILDRVQTTYPNVKNDTRVLVRTADIPNDNVSARGGLPPALFTRIQDGLLKAVSTAEGRKLLKDGIGNDSLAKGDDKEYDPLRTAASVLKIDLEKAIKPAPTATRPPS
jgi:phosphonate transport system substrate-binding protein